MNAKDDGFIMTQQGSLPAGTQAISFADVGMQLYPRTATVPHTYPALADRDGTLDMLFATCSSVESSTGIGSGCSVNIAYNKQLPLCASASGQNVVNGKRTCRPPGDLCTADPDFRFDLHESPDNDVCACWPLCSHPLMLTMLQAFVRVPLSDIFPPTKGSSVQPGLLVMDTIQDPPVPVPIKLGDVNQDGFPDLLAIVVHGSGSHGQRTPNLVMSVPCAKSVAGCSGSGGGRRGWQAVKKDADPLLKIQDARSAAFLDMDEDVSRAELSKSESG